MTLVYYYSNFFQKQSVEETALQTPSETNPVCPSTDSELVDTNTTNQLVQTTATEQGLLWLKKFSWVILDIAQCKRLTKNQDDV